MLGQSHGLQILLITPFDFKRQNLQMSLTNFCGSSYRYTFFKIFTAEKVDQGHGVQFSQLPHSMVNIKIYKYLPDIFVLARIVSEIQKYKHFDLQKVGQVQFWQLHHSMANVKIDKCHLNKFLFDFCSGVTYAKYYNRHINGQAHGHR